VAFVVSGDRPGTLLPDLERVQDHRQRDDPGVESQKMKPDFR